MATERSHDVLTLTRERIGGVELVHRGVELCRGGQSSIEEGKARYNDVELV